MTPCIRFALGNHDFDDGIEGLKPFLQQVNFPVLAANIDLSKSPDLQNLIKPSIVKEIDGTKIGIIGYITPKTVNISNPGPNLIFHHEIYAVQREINILKKQGVNVFIGLGHSGFGFDKYLAKVVPDLDLVIGGHSHSFLYSGENPPDKPEGNYPTYIHSENGKIIPVVQVSDFKTTALQWG